MGGKDRLPVTGDAAAIVAALVARARAAQAAFDAATQDEVDEVVTAVGWAIVDPEHNRALSELAVGDTGLGNVKDKMAKNRRKTMGLLRDLAGVKSVGVIAAEPEKGLVEIARPVGIVVLSLGLVLSLAALFRKAPDIEPSSASDRFFQAGWFQAVLVVTALATLVVVSLPYILTWLHR